jgi:hypothetical protein
MDKMVQGAGQKTAYPTVAKLSVSNFPKAVF